MSLNLTDVNTEYEKNQNLKKNEVEKFLNFVNEQPHLPKISELQAILFLHCCYYDEITAKKRIETFFTLKTSNPDLFKQRNPLESPIKECLNVFLYTPLPKKTPEGYTVMLVKLMDTNPSNFQCLPQLKIFDMVKMLHLFQDGTSEGHVTIIDMKGGAFRHLFKLSPFGLKKFFHYIQEAVPERAKTIHFINIVPFMDRLMSLLRSFMKKEFADLICLHKSIEDLAKFVPLECLPEDYGGSAESTSILHEKIKRRVFDNVDFFEWEEQQYISETKKPK